MLTYEEFKRIVQIAKDCKEQYDIIEENTEDEVFKEVEGNYTYYDILKVMIDNFGVTTYKVANPEMDELLSDAIFDSEIENKLLKTESEAEYKKWYNALSNPKDFIIYSLLEAMVMDNKTISTLRKKLGKKEDEI